MIDSGLHKAIAPGLLRPYISVMLLECTSNRAILERATFKVISSHESADFLLEVGLDGSLGGHLRAPVRMKGDRVTFNFGIDGTPTNPGPVRQVRDALRVDQQNQRSCGDKCTHWQPQGHLALQLGNQALLPGGAHGMTWGFIAPGHFHASAARPPGYLPADTADNSSVRDASWQRSGSVACAMIPAIVAPAQASRAP
jgi:hypothetical protein